MYSDGTLCISGTAGGGDWNDDDGYATGKVITPTKNDTVYVKIRPYNASAISKDFGIVYSTGATRPVVKNPDDVPVTLSSVTPVGSPTTALTLTFDKAITGLSAGDITLDINNSFGVTKGTLSGAGPTYTLGFGSPVDGSLTVTVAKTGYDITDSSKTVNISGNAKSLTAGQWTDGNLTAGSSVDWYSFTATAGTTYRIWWNDKYQGPDPKNKDGDVVVSAWSANGTNIFGGSSTNGGEDSGWDTAQEFTATGTVYVKVMPYNASDSYKGSYGIVFTANNATRP
jgi:hypothetical protein